MSTEKNIREAIRWLTTADDDIGSAVILKNNGKFAHSCFHAQQAGEKALKAVWYFADADPWGHSIKKLIEDLNFVDLKIYQKLEPYSRMGMVLDRFYIPTRYPDALPGIFPDALPGRAEAEEALELARVVLERIV